MSDNTTPTIIVSEATFSTNFKLFAPDGTQVQFTCRAGSNYIDHLTELATYRASLADQGYSAEAPANGAEEGEKIEEVAGYVRGTTKAGQPLVWLYSAKEVLKWRLTTVYEEHLGDLPFSLEGPVWPGAAAPEREEAASKGYLQPVPAFRVVLAENGQTDEGKPRWKFAHCYGASASASTAPTLTPAVPTPAAKTVAAAARASRSATVSVPAPTAAPVLAAPNANGATAPDCPKCGGAMWDNRMSKKNPAAPDWRCKDKACDGVVWPPKKEVPF